MKNSQVNQPIQQAVNLLMLQAEMASTSAQGAVLLQQGIEQLVQSDRPDHWLATKLAAKLAATFDNETSPSQTAVWTNKAWRRIVSTGEFACYAAFEIVEARANAAIEQKEVSQFTDTVDISLGAARADGDPLSV